MKIIKFLKKENEINKLIKDQRLSGKREAVLFTSLWDKYSVSLLDKLTSKGSKLPITVVNSFDTPHSFIIWNITKVPALVLLEGSGKSKRTRVIDYLPDIYRRLEVINRD